MHFLRGPSEGFDRPALSTWRSSCVSRRWELSGARKHVPRGKRRRRCAQCEPRKGTTLKRERRCWRQPRASANTCQTAPSRDLICLKRKGNAQDLSKVLVKRTQSSGTQKQTLSGPIQGSKSIAAHVPEMSLGSGICNLLFVCLLPRTGASITVQSLHVPLGNDSARCTNPAGRYSTLYLCRYSVNTCTEIIITQPAGAPICAGHSAMWRGNEWEQDVSAYMRLLAASRTLIQSGGRGTTWMKW